MNITVMYKSDSYRQTYKWVSTIQNSHTIYAICVNHNGNIFTFDITDIKVIDKNYMGEWP